jgi:outer membrane protein OmpA-like peptidoglycan-associated protein
VKIRKQEVALALAAIGLLSYAACTAEKTSMKNDPVSSVSMPKPEVMTQTVKEGPKLVDGIYATDDHLMPVYFELNKSKISDKEMETVKTNAEWLKGQPPFLVRIVGFADQRGSMKKNERLAERRAMFLRDTYVELGITKDRISIVTRGAETPACQPVTEDCLAKSRRTETLLEDKSLASR